MNIALEILHLSRLQQYGISSLEIRRPAVGGVLVGALDDDQQTRAARQRDDVTFWTRAKRRIVLGAEVDAARLSILEFDRDPVVAAMGAGADRVDVRRQRRVLRSD